ncbi:MULTISPECIES: adenylate cyclase [Paenibacillus]|uniref:adenylate cyclase n=1 Tax=Paenibacillus TaxID=44249 RepID=UPI00119DCF30|nr:adenylate cyclase [Paenibacillus sp. Y412MC10]
MKFSGYDFRGRKKTVEEVLDNTDEVTEVSKFPRDADFTYSHGYKAWASTIFVSIRDSDSLFSKKDEVGISKIIRGFTSEIIDILRKDTDDTELKEIGIRSNSLYAIYSTPKKGDIYDLATRAFYINTYMNMLNSLLEARNLSTIEIGIGLAAQNTLVVKAGHESSGIQNLMWIGGLVTKAFKLSDLGNKKGIGPIVMSKTFHSNYLQRAKYKEKKFWRKVKNSKYGDFYHGDVVISDFNNWIIHGMKS